MRRGHDVKKITGRRVGARALAACLLLLPLVATGADTPEPPRDPALPRSVAPATPPAIAAPAPIVPHIVVNVPAFRLDVYLAGERWASYPVTVGMPRLPTPSARLAIRELIWNPWWHPPAHRRPKDKVTPPGPRNPMGRVKLHLTRLLYIHGTANLRDIGRAASRACVRMRNDDAIALARLVQQCAGSALSAAEVEELVQHPSRTRRVPLDHPVPVDLVYRPVEVRDGMVLVHRDLYGRWPATPQELVLGRLEAGGIAPEQIDLAALDTVLEGSAPVGFTLATVLDANADAPRRTSRVQRRR